MISSGVGLKWSLFIGQTTKRHDHFGFLFFLRLLTPGFGILPLDIFDKLLLAAVLRNKLRSENDEKANEYFMSLNER